MSEDDPLHQPNDKLFKQVFGDPATAAGFLSAYLPEPISKAVDWKLLQAEPGSFIDSQFRQHESDLLFLVIRYPRNPHGGFAPFHP